MQGLKQHHWSILFGHGHSVSVTIAVCCKKYWLLHCCHDYGASVTIAVFCKKYWASVMLLQWQLSVAKEWHISEIMYPTAYDKVPRSARGSNFFYILSVILVASLSVSVFFILFGRLDMVVWWSKHFSRFSCKSNSPRYFSRDALFVMAACSLPYTFLLVIHCLVWLLFLLTANLNIAFG